MLAKLMKYDLKWTYKLVVIYYALALVCSLAARLFMLGGSVLFDVLTGVASGCAVAMMISGLINTLIRSWVRFVRNMYKDEAYLTHTLPVEKKTIYASKVLSALICSLTSVTVAVLCLFICYYSEENIASLKAVLNLAAAAYDTTVLNIIFIMTAVVFMEFVFILFVGYVGIILGHRSDSGKMARSFLWGFGVYIAVFLLMLLLLFFAGMFSDSVRGLISGSPEAVSIGTIKAVLCVSILLYAAFSAVCCFVGKHQLEKGVNVD